MCALLQLVCVAYASTVVELFLRPVLLGSGYCMREDVAVLLAVTQNDAEQYHCYPFAWQRLSWPY